MSRPAVGQPMRGRPNPLTCWGAKHWGLWLREARHQAENLPGGRV